MGETFLCTAKHVIDENINSRLYLDGPSQLEIIEGNFYTSKEHDVAALKLTPAQVESFQKYHPLREDLLASQTDTAASKYVVFVGFPENKNRKTHQQHKIKAHV